MIQPRTENGKARCRAIYDEYSRILKEKGADAKCMTRKYFYETVADTLGYSPSYVKEVVNMMLKKR